MKVKNSLFYSTWNPNFFTASEWWDRTNNTPKVILNILPEREKRLTSDGKKMDFEVYFKYMSEIARGVANVVEIKSDSMNKLNDILSDVETGNYVKKVQEFNENLEILAKEIPNINTFISLIDYLIESLDLSNENVDLLKESLIGDKKIDRLRITPKELSQDVVQR